MSDIYSDVPADQNKIDALLPLIRGLARDNVARSMTDFLGRMSEALMEADGCCPDGVLDEEQQEVYHEAMVELAALALAQAAMSALPLRTATRSDE